MRKDLHCLRLARITLESTTGLSIATGFGEGARDTLLVRDANGLPALPGSSIAGVLRHLYQAHFQASANLPDGESPPSPPAQKSLGGDSHGDQTPSSSEDLSAKDISSSEELFGHITDRGEEGGEASRLFVGWGAVHDGENRPIEGLVLKDADSWLEDDPVLRLLADPHPVIRDHVRIGARGTADDGAKFERTTLPPGCRFTFELALWDKTLKKTSTWERLLGLLNSPRFRLGGATRRGLGAFKLVAIHQGAFDLKLDPKLDPKRTDDFKAFQELKPELGKTEGLKEQSPEALAPIAESSVTATLRLTPEDFWRFGQGDAPLWDAEESAPDQRDDPDLMALTTPVIVWKNTDGKVEGQVKTQQLLIPASAIKGALAHRFRFHYARLIGYWAQSDGGKGQQAPDAVDPTDEAVEALFGSIKENLETDPPQRRGGSPADQAEAQPTKGGRVGRLLIDDMVLDPLSKRDGEAHAAQMVHNSLDRFTGGTRRGALFTEELIHGLPHQDHSDGAQSPSTLNLKITLLDPESISVNEDVRKNIHKALDMTLSDLTQGRLALGGGSARGHGGFSGPDVVWSDNGQWIEGRVDS